MDSSNRVIAGLRCTSHVYSWDRRWLMVLRDLMMRRRGPPWIVPISHYFMRRKRPFLYRIRPKLLCNYPRRVLEGSGQGRWQGQVMHRHRLRVRICALRKDEVGGSMILRYYSMSAALFFVARRQENSPLSIYVWEISRTRIDVENDEAAPRSRTLYVLRLSFWRRRFAYQSVTARSY